MRFPSGFAGGSTAAGLKASGAEDLGVIVSDRPCAAAGVFTRNKFVGANITVCREALRYGSLRGIVVHAGQANACTGKEGEKVARATAQAAATAFDTEPTDFVVGSTGVIGVVPSITRIRSGINAVAAHSLTPEGIPDVGRAMMTTDLVAKTACARFRLDGKLVTILGIAKGSGMIHPNMGTMLAYLLTDASISKATLAKALRSAADASFNCMTVDGDTSTSDMCVALANGAAGNRLVAAESAERETFTSRLTGVCIDLARRVAQDGEGATRLVTIRVRGAASVADARRVGKAVGGSNLVKTAIFGRDPNWGRIACAIGYSEAQFEPERVSIKLGGIPIFLNGRPVGHKRPPLSSYLCKNSEVLIEIHLRAGQASADIWTCDFSYDYVRINAEYTT